MPRPADSSRSERRRAQLAERRGERRERGHPKWVAPALGAAFLLSGAAGLVHEVVWVRLLGFVFGVTRAGDRDRARGVHGRARARELARRHAQRAHRRPPPRLRLARDRHRRRARSSCRCCSCVVQPLYAALWRRFHLSFASFSVLRFLVAGSLLLGPTVLMGATLPVLADHLARVEGRRVAPSWLYTMNLLGAVLGVALAGFVLMPAIGITGTILVGALLNVGVGVWVLLMPTVPERAPAAPAAADAGERPGRLLFLAAFASGALALVTQVAWTRVLTLVVGSTTYAFSAVLLVYLLALGAGSALAARRGARGGASAPTSRSRISSPRSGSSPPSSASTGCRYWYMGLYDVVRSADGGRRRRARDHDGGDRPRRARRRGGHHPAAGARRRRAARRRRHGPGGRPPLRAQHARRDPRRDPRRLPARAAPRDADDAPRRRGRRRGHRPRVRAGDARARAGSGRPASRRRRSWRRASRFGPTWNFHDLHAGVAEPGRYSREPSAAPASERARRDDARAGRRRPRRRTPSRAAARTRGRERALPARGADGDRRRRAARQRRPHAGHQRAHQRERRDRSTWARRCCSRTSRSCSRRGPTTCSSSAGAAA